MPTIAVYELDPSCFQCCAPLFRCVWFDEAQISSVLEGRQRGRVFVDDPHAPTAALICRTYGFYVSGAPASTSIRAFIRDAPAEARVFQHLYGYMVLPVWADVLYEECPEGFITVDRLAFHHPGSPLPRVSGSDFAAVQPIGADSVKRIDEELNLFIGRVWEGYENFRTGGFGFYTTVDDEVASVAYSIAVSTRSADIDVETVGKFQRRGLAKAVSARYVEECARRNIIATWGCDAANTASIAAAHSLGFVPDPPFVQVSPKPGVARVRSEGIWQCTPGDGERVARIFSRPA